MTLMLIANILPLWILMGVGYIGGRWLEINLHSIARINIFLLIPFVTFGAIARMEFDPAYLLLPTSLCAISVIITLGAYALAKRVWQGDARANLIGASAANGNTIYFGLPLILTFFGPEIVGVYLFMNMGPQLSNLTLAYFISARGQHPWQESLKKVAIFPALHASWLGIVVNLLGWEPPAIFNQYWEYGTGATVILGMMMIGVALGKISLLLPDMKLLRGLFTVKFLVWPALCYLLVLADQLVFNLFPLEIHQVVMIFAVMPLMGSLVAYAAEYDLYPERAASAVLLSILAMLIIIPAIFWLMGVS